MISRKCQHVCSFEGANLYSSLAQSVEHAAVNRSVVGSSPTGGAFLCQKRVWEGSGRNEIDETCKIQENVSCRFFCIIHSIIRVIKVLCRVNADSVIV